MSTRNNASFLSYLSVFICGLLFALGLQLSGMTQPQKVQGFLDVFGLWDPSLMLVLFAALLVFSLGYHLLVKPRVNRQLPPMLADKFHLPIKTQIDKPLVLGALIFGLGWGLVGLCPGPAMANLVQLDLKIIVFILAMLLGIKAAGKVNNN